MVEENILQVENGGQETLWNKLVPKKGNIFTWRALKGRLVVRHRWVVGSLKVAAEGGWLQRRVVADYNGRWLLVVAATTRRVVCGQHNHLPIVNLEGHAYARRLSEDEFRLVEDLTSKNVPQREILSMLKDQDETNLSTLPIIYESQKKIHKNEKGAKTPMQFLMYVLHIHRYVYEPYTHPVTNELQALFYVILHLMRYGVHSRTY
nr:protein FAR1-related sequence 5-like [Tanacetum cinerariifolium]